MPSVSESFLKLMWLIWGVVLWPLFPWCCFVFVSYCDDGLISRYFSIIRYVCDVWWITGVLLCITWFYRPTILVLHYWCLGDYLVSSCTTLILLLCGSSIALLELLILSPFGGWLLLLLVSTSYVIISFFSPYSTTNALLLSSEIIGILTCRLN